MPDWRHDIYEENERVVVERYREEGDGRQRDMVAITPCPPGAPRHGLPMRNRDE